MFIVFKITFAIYGNCIFASEIDIKGRSFSTECQEALYTIMRRPLASETKTLWRSKEKIQTTLDSLNSIFHGHHEQVHTKVITAVSEKLMDKPQIFQRMRFQSGYESNRQKFDYRIFYFRRASLSALELSNIANRSVRGREFHRIVLHFKNGDTISTKIVRGLRQTVQPDFKDLEDLLHEIAAGAKNGSDGKPFNISDIIVAETIHNHPFAYFVRITPRTPRLVRNNENQSIAFPWVWMGNMSPSAQDELSTEIGLAGAFRTVLGRRLQDKLEGIILRETILNSQAQMVSVDVGVKFFDHLGRAEFFRDGSEIRSIW